MTILGTRRRTLLAFVAVLGPGLLAGLSDDDPAGITTYAVLGAREGYGLLWVLVASTVCLILFHSLGARLGLVTGQGLVGLTRQRYGVRWAAVAITALLVANLGTTCAEFAGIAAGFELFGVSKYLSVPTAAFIVSFLVLRGGFHRVEHILMALSAVFLSYIGAAILAHPDWGATARGVAVPALPSTRDAIVLATATLGTTLAPWGLSFIQSYVADKRLTVADLRYENIDTTVGAVLTGIIGIFVVVACAATLHANGIGINDAVDAARALEPLAGAASGRLFGLGLIGAGVLAASIVPLSTAYSVSEFVGTESAIDDDFREARLFYITFIAITGVSGAIVLIPGAPLIVILLATQVLNAIVLIPLLVFMYGLSRDRDLLGDHVASKPLAAAYLVVIGLVTMALISLAWSSLA
jgi:NRAMP (natural resistance-associated macrophage protein)-like metal ion transporter